MNLNELSEYPYVLPLDESNYLYSFQSSLRSFDIGVSRSFRNIISVKYPNLCQNQQHLRLFAYLLFTSFLDADTHYPIVSREVLASLRDEFKLVQQGKFRVAKILDDFQEFTSIRLKVVPYKHSHGRATQARLELDAELQQQYQQELECDKQEIYLVSGKPCSIRQKQHDKKLALAAARAKNPDRSRVNISVLDYLNSIKSNVYRQFQRNIKTARVYVINEYSGPKQEQHLRILRHLDTFFHPHYQQVENTERLYTVGASVSQLSSPVRKLIFQGCRTYDLSNAHLAITATLWGLHDLRRLLKEQKTIWPYLLNLLELNEQQKPALKRVIYATVYGMPESSLKGLITRSLGRDVTERFMESEFGQTLLTSRDYRMNQIRELGYVEDAYGRKYYVDPNHVEKSIRTLLSREISSYEFKIMSSIIRVLDGNKKAQCVLWLHDGVTIRYSDRSQMERWERKIIAEVNAAADELGVESRLEWEDKGSNPACYTLDA